MIFIYNFSSFTTLHNVCAVHRGCVVQRGMFSTLEGYHEYSGGYHEYSGGYHEYTGGCSVHRFDIMSTLGDIMINVGEGHWENNWICMETPVYWTFLDVLKLSPTLIVESLQCTHGIPRCTEHIPLYLSYPPTLIVESHQYTHGIPRCTKHIPLYSRYPPHSSWYPPVYSGYPPLYSTPPVYSRYPPDVLNDKPSPRTIFVCKIPPLGTEKGVKSPTPGT